MKPSNYSPFDDASGAQLLTWLAYQGITAEASGFSLNNNTYLQARNAANSADLNLLKADTSDNTVLNAKTGKAINLDINAAAILALTASNLTFTPGLFYINANTADAADTSGIGITGGGAAGTTRGANIIAYGNEAVAAGGYLQLEAGNVANSVINNYLSAASSTWNILDNAAAIVLTVNASGNLIFNAASASIIPGATSLLFRNNANAVSNLILADNGFLTSPVTTAGFIQGIASIPANVSAITNTGLGLLIAKNTSSNSDNAALLAFGANTVGANFDAFKTRANDGSAGTIVVSGDTIFQLTGLGADGTAYRRAASIVMTVDGTPGASDMPGAIDFQCTPDGSATLASVLKLGNDKVATHTGDVKITTAGKGYFVQSGANAKAGTLVANGSTGVTVSTTALTANSTVTFGLKTVGGTTAPVYMDTVNPGTGFTIKSTAGNTSTYNWVIVDLI